MHEFDVLVIGGGAANKVASAASGDGQETALIAPGPLGGTAAEVTDAGLDHSSLSKITWNTFQTATA